MGGSAGIGALRGEVNGSRMGLGAGIVGVGLGLVGEVPLPAAPLSRVPPGSPAPETAPEITAGGVSSVSDPLALVDSVIPNLVAFPAPIARTTSLGFSALMVSLMSVAVIALFAS